MGFRTGAYAKIWNIDQNDKGIRAQLSISSKNKSTGEYETQFSDFVSFYGDAKNMATNLKAGDRIRLGDVDIRNKYVKDQSRTYYYPCIYTFEMADGAAKPATQPKAKDEPTVVSAVEYAVDEDPF